jgi:hypothetical protein
MQLRFPAATPCSLDKPLRNQPLPCVEATYSSEAAQTSGPLSAVIGADAPQNPKCPYDAATQPLRLKSIPDMRSTHLVIAAAVRGVAERLGRGRDRSVALEGNAYREPQLAAADRCRVEGCGARATRFAMRPDGSEIAVCARCGEELEALLGIASTADTRRTDSAASTHAPGL